ncbi:hypothetical protein, partial [Burkholderia ambifaria]|uniref:hypothetical protein n=1 Tax=Burkholderia ambifaria TaxID=152480 RepID=UPI00158D1A60
MNEIHEISRATGGVYLFSERGKMKQRVLAMAVRQIVWEENALAATLAVPAFAQSQPAAGPAAVADALASGPAI